MFWLSLSKDEFIPSSGSLNMDDFIDLRGSLGSLLLFGFLMPLGYASLECFTYPRPGFSFEILKRYLPNARIPNLCFSSPF